MVRLQKMPGKFVVCCAEPKVRDLEWSGHSLEKKWNFLLKHTSGNVQEISNEIYCSKTVVIPYLGNITCLGHFLASMEISDFIYFF